MNTRRGFFKSLGLMLAGAATAAPGIFIPRFEPVHWKVLAEPAKPLPDHLFASYYKDVFGKWRWVTLEEIQRGGCVHNTALGEQSLWLTDVKTDSINELPMGSLKLITDPKQIREILHENAT